MFRIEVRTFHRCPSPDCGLEFVWPQPSDDELTSAYLENYYSGAAREKCVETPTEVYEQVLGLLPSTCRARERIAILDVGCATGGLFDVLPPTWREGYAGVETNERARVMARQRTGRPVVASIDEACELGPARWDVTILSQVIEHLRTPVEEMAKLRKACAPEGVLLVATPNADCLKRMLLGPRWEQYQQPTHLFMFRWSALRRCLELAGWTTSERVTTPLHYPDGGAIRNAVRSLLRATGYDGNLTAIARA